MDNRPARVRVLEQLPYRAHRRLAWAAAERDALPPFADLRVHLAHTLGIIAARVREARGQTPAPASVRPG